MKRIITLICVISMLLCTTSGYAFAEDVGENATIEEEATTNVADSQSLTTNVASLVEETDDYAYYSDGTFHVKSNSAKVPDAYKASVKRATFDSEVTEIARGAFKDCTVLTEVELPYGLQKIGGGNSYWYGRDTDDYEEFYIRVDSKYYDGAFSGCINLTSITLPETVTTIQRGAFSGSGLKKVVIPQNVKKIDRYVFKDCSALEEVILPEGITLISEEAFAGCNSLSFIRIPASVESVYQYAFAETGLKVVVLMGHPYFHKEGYDWYGNAFKDVSATIFFDIWSGSPERRDYGGNLKWIPATEAFLNSSREAFFAQDAEEVATRPITPVINTVSVIDDGVYIAWDAVPNAFCYGIMIKDNGGDWEELSVTPDESNVTIRPQDLGDDGEKSVAVFAEVTFNEYPTAEGDGEPRKELRSPVSASASFYWSAITLETPTILDIANGVDGINIAWKEVDNASFYTLRSKVEGGEWAVVADGLTQSTYTVPKNELTSGVQYWYSVQANGSEEGKRSNFSEEAAQTWLEQPQIIETENRSDGTEVSWSSVSGASTYTLLYRTDNGEWKTAAEGITETSYILPKGKMSNRTTYYYSVQAIGENEGICSALSGDVPHMWITTPVITDMECTADGILVGWSDVYGIDSYTLLYRNGDNEWKIAEESIKGTTFIMPKERLANGTQYDFCVQAIDMVENASSGYSKSEIQTWFMAPEVIKTQNLSSGTKVVWSAVDKAKSYTLRYRTTAGEWKIVAEDITDSSYTVPKSKLSSGTKYWYAVQAVGEESDERSAFSTDKAQTWLATPSVTKTQNMNAGTKISWEKVNGASGYIVMCKLPGGTWKTVSTVVGGDTLTYLMPKSKLSSGTKYYYTVKTKGAATSGYTSGKAQTYLAAPSVSTVSKLSSGVKITWSKVKGASSYIVMYKVSGGTWKTVKSGITATSYIVSSSELTKGKTYYFTVKAKGTATSGYSSGKSIKIN